MLQAVIVDDNPNHRLMAYTIAKELLQDVGCEIACFKNSDDMLFYKSLCPDIAILDIELNCKTNGIDIAREIAQKYPCCQIIFLTSHLDYISNVYEVPHVYLVLKKDIQLNFKKALEKALQQLKEISGKALIVQDTAIETHKINQSNIIYLERIGRITLIHTILGTIKTHDSISKLDFELDTSKFIRCHQSFIANLSFAKTVKRINIELNNGIVLPISRKYSLPVQTAFSSYISGLIFNKFN